MLQEACRQAREWQDLYPSDPPLVMCVNVSGRQFRYPRLAQEVAQVLRQTRLEPGSLDLEITENVLVEDFRSKVATVHRLKRLGVKLIIDDFGTGYSSLSYLKRLPLDRLKIDRSFVEGLEKDPKDEGIVSAVIDLAQVLAMEAIAEGVESAEQAARLRQLGCQLAKGTAFPGPYRPRQQANCLPAWSSWERFLAIKAPAVALDGGEACPAGCAASLLFVPRSRAPTTSRRKPSGSFRGLGIRFASACVCSTAYAGPPRRSRFLLTLLFLRP